MGKITRYTKQAPNVNYTGTWSGLAGGVEVQLEEASDEAYGEGNFGTGGKTIATDAGTSGQALQEGVDYSYDTLLDSGGSDLYDTSNSGALSNPIRVVENGTNVANAGGLNLNIRAKDLTANVVSPPTDECWVDPAIGKFRLPRPDFWSKCENVANCLSPEIKQNTPIINNGGGGYTQDGYSGKFNNCIVFNAYNSSPWIAYYPLGQNTPEPDNYTMSFWMKNTPDVNRRGLMKLPFGSGDSYITFYELSEVGPQQNYFLSNGAVVCVKDATTFSSFKHVYILVDRTASLSGGKTGIVFINGVEEFSTTTVPSAGAGTFWLSISGYGVQTTYFYFDNIKIWNHIVSEDPSFEYNSGSGRETFIHNIYASGNNYQPVLNGASSGLGYYYIADSATPAQLNQTDSGSSKLKISNI